MLHWGLCPIWIASDSWWNRSTCHSEQLTVNLCRAAGTDVIARIIHKGVYLFLITLKFDVISTFMVSLLGACSGICIAY